MKLYNYDYDLKNENPKLRDCNGDALYKFLLYKAEDSSFDCDRCSYIREIYDRSSVSLREIRRFSIFFEWFLNYLMEKKNIKLI